eukprot:scaffold65881_cov31-Tisochrysis_lutea.AAC.1
MRVVACRAFSVVSRKDSLSSSSHIDEQALGGVTVSLTEPMYSTLPESRSTKGLKAGPTSSVETPSLGARRNSSHSFAAPRASGGPACMSGNKRSASLSCATAWSLSDAYTSAKAADWAVRVIIPSLSSRTAGSATSAQRSCSRQSRWYTGRSIGDRSGWHTLGE